MANFKETVEIDSYSFRRGWKQLKLQDYKAAKKDLMNALHIVALATFLRRLNGEVEPKPSEAAAIESVFAKYGITKVWGE